MTIDEKKMEYYRTKVIGKYVTPIMEQYSEEERIYKEEENRVKRMLEKLR